AGVGRKLVECEADGLGGDRVQVQLLAAYGDPRSDHVGKMRKLGAHQVLCIDALPLVTNQQVLIGRERLEALGEAADEVFALTGCGLASNCLHETEHVLGAMIGFAHQKMNLLLSTFARGDVAVGFKRIYLAVVGDTDMPTLNNDFTAVACGMGEFSIPAAL